MILECHSHISHKYTFAPCQVKVLILKLECGQVEYDSSSKAPPLAEFHGILYAPIEPP